MSKKLLIILDPAHGRDVAGKRSPDGKHQEWIWSRERSKDLSDKLQKLGYKVVFTNETDNEIGLSRRKEIANKYASENSKLIPFLISLHNNAAADGSKWMSASGVEAYTSVGRTTSDIFANYILQELRITFPSVPHRYNQDVDKERDKESNFTVLMGTYFAVLVEFLFQDNKDDVNMLLDENVNRKFTDCIVTAVEKCNNYIITNTN